MKLIRFYICAAINFLISQMPTKTIDCFLSLPQSEAYNRMKLMVVGYGGRGKSTLLARLQGQKHVRRNDNVATVGVVVKEWT